MWFVAIRNVNYDVKTSTAKVKNLRVCSNHFTEQDNERDLMAGFPHGDNTKEKTEQYGRSISLPMDGVELVLC